MNVIAAILVLAAVPQKAPCETARKKSGDLNRVHAAWLTPHSDGCPLCARGSTCREGFERKSAVRKQYKDWNDVHAMNCRACGAARCTALQTNTRTWTKQAHEDHQARHKSCAFDAKRCLSWKVAMGQVKRKVQLFKAEHPAMCTVCGPRCRRWRRHAAEVTARYEDTLQRHHGACYECKRSSGDCEQPARFKTDWGKQRLALWKAHTATCICRRAALRR